MQKPLPRASVMTTMMESCPDRGVFIDGFSVKSSASLMVCQLIQSWFLSPYLVRRVSPLLHREDYLSGIRAWSQSPRREAEGGSRLHSTITDWPDSGYTRRIPFIPEAPPPWP